MPLTLRFTGTILLLVLYRHAAPLGVIRYYKIHFKFELNDTILSLDMISKYNIRLK